MRAPATAPRSPAPEKEADEKRRTAKISLEAALAASETDGPRTIRLRRPSDAPVGETVRTKSGEAPDQTASADTNETGKKTIRIKRTPTAPGVEVASDLATGAAPIGMVSVRVADRPHWAFLVTAIAATLVVAVNLYVLASQAFGPDVCGTQLSYGVQDLSLPWPGKTLPPASGSW
jgi:hypothetical protein